MAEDNQVDPSTRPRVTFGQRAKKAGLFILFGVILFIPRIRRLRRRPGAWACVRLVVAAFATWLVWRHMHGNAGVASLVAGLFLFAFSLLVHARPVTKSVDAIANDLGALIVLNGGIFRETLDSNPIRRAQIFVHPAQVIVQDPDERRLLEIPLAKFRNLTVHPANCGKRKGPESWEVEINWEADGPCTTTFYYEGPFAEHLAQVTESTLRSQWKKELPVFHQ
jgi:hypothetical protein